MNESITEYSLPNNSSRQSRIYLPNGTNDFSFHKPVSGVHKSVCTRNHHLVVHFEGETIGDLETGDVDMRKIEESSDNKLYNKGDKSDVSENDNDILTSAVNINDVNLRQNALQIHNTSC